MCTPLARSCPPRPRIEFSLHACEIQGNTGIAIRAAESVLQRSLRQRFQVRAACGNRRGRAADLIVNRSVGSQADVAPWSEWFAGEIRHPAAGFADEQRARRRVPRFQTEFPEG